MADYFLAEHDVKAMSMFPHPYVMSRAGWDYPSVGLSPRTIRRHALLVKHEATSPLADYVVLRDEVRNLGDGSYDEPALHRALGQMAAETVDIFMRDRIYLPRVLNGISTQGFPPAT